MSMLFATLCIVTIITQLQSESATFDIKQGTIIGTIEYLHSANSLDALPQLKQLYKYKAQHGQILLGDTFRISFNIENRLIRYSSGNLLTIVGVNNPLESLNIDFTSDTKILQISTKIFHASKRKPETYGPIKTTCNNTCEYKFQMTKSSLIINNVTFTDGRYKMYQRSLSQYVGLTGHYNYRGNGYSVTDLKISTTPPSHNLNSYLKCESQLLSFLEKRKHLPVPSDWFIGKVISSNGSLELQMNTLDNELDSCKYVAEWKYIDKKLEKKNLFLKLWRTVETRTVKIFSCILYLEYYGDHKRVSNGILEINVFKDYHHRKYRMKMLSFLRHRSGVNWG